MHSKEIEKAQVRDWVRKVAAILRHIWGIGKEGLRKDCGYSAG